MRSPTRPIPAIHEVVRWRPADLAQWIWEGFSIALSAPTGAALMLDQAGWHMSTVPDNITLLPLPPRSPALNPVENIWQFMRENWLSNSIFKSHDDIVALGCDAWNNLAERPWKIMTIGTLEWAHGS